MEPLAISFSIHLIGIVFWIGSAFLLPLVVLPALKSLEPDAQATFLATFRKSFLPFFIAAGLLVGITGTIQTVAMESDLNIPAIWTKHIVILFLIVVSLYLWIFLLGKVVKSLKENKGWGNQLVILSWVQAVLGIAVLVLTGWLTQ